MLNKLKKYGLFEYGKVVPKLIIHGKEAPYPVVNEREVRAGAGIMLMIAIFAVSNAWFDQNYFYLKGTVLLFFIDFFAKVVLGFEFSPINRIARLIVSNQKPDYVGAIQKRFAWSIGLFMSTLMFFLIYIFEVRGPINASVCMLCITFFWLETSFGICVGCKIYYALIHLRLIKEPIYRPACPGGTCSINR